MANFNLEKMVNEFSKATMEEKESTIDTLNDLLAVTYLEQEKKLKEEIQVVASKIARMKKQNS